MTEPRRVFVGTMYHDSEEDAAVDQMDLEPYFPSLDAAVAAVNERKDDRWQVGSVTAGWFYPGIPGKRPDHFESDGDGSWFVGTDGKPDR